MKKYAYKDKVAIIYLTTFFIDLVNMFITTIAFPHIATALNASFEQLSWIANIYTLALALVIPASSWLSETFGLKKVFTVALLGLLITSILCGSAQSITQLIIWRFFQGISGGLLIPVGQTMVYKQFSPNERATLSMIILAVASIAPAISPTIGGIIVDMLNWRWIFYINVPIILIMLILSLVWLVEDKNQHVKKFDWFGMALVSVALILTLYALSSFKSIADFTYSGTILGGGVLIALIFLVYSIKVPHAILDLKVIKSNLFIAGMLFYICIPGVFTGIGILNTFLFQNVLNLTATQTGALMVPFSIGIFLGIIVAGKVFNKIGPKPISFIAMLIWATGVLLLLVVSNKSQYSLAMFIYFIMGIGSGTSSFIAQTISMLNIKNEDLSRASAIWNLNRQLSFSFSVAILSMIFQVLLNLYGIHATNNFHYSQNIITVFHECFIIAASIVIIPVIATLCFSNTMVLNIIRGGKA